MGFWKEYQPSQVRNQSRRRHGGRGTHFLQNTVIKIWPLNEAAYISYFLPRPRIALLWWYYLDEGCKHRSMM